MTQKVAVSKDKQWFSLFASAGVFLFFAPTLSVPRGYTAGAVILLLAGLWHLAKRPFASLTVEDKQIVFLMAGVFGVNLFSVLYHHNAPRELDLASRYLLTVPILLLLIKYPPKARIVWAAVAVGSISAAGVALWDTVALNLERATGTTGGIQFGNLGLMLAVFNLAGAIEAWRTRHQTDGKWWCVWLAIGSTAGLYVSISSGSRGGWVAVPLIGVVFLIAYTGRNNIKYVVAAILLLLAAAIAAVATVPAIESRYDEAVEDIEQYEKGNPYTSLGQRLAMYEALAIAIPQKPWLGWSRSDFNAELERQVREGMVSDAVLRLANTHNTYLEVWVYQGLLGLAMLLAFMVAALVYFLRSLRAPTPQARAAAVCGASLIIGYAVFSMTHAMLARNNTLLFFLVSLAVFWAMAKPSANRTPYIKS